MPDTPDIVLSVRGLHAAYGASRALHGMDFDVPRGQVVTLMGRNGAGKTTTLRAVIGLMKTRSGSIRVDGTETIGLTPERIARLGVALCPEERAIFGSLTVAENLRLPPVLRPGGLSDDEIEQLFPRLRERRSSYGNRLSGGEQQMLALARILRTGANLLLLDEITEGLAPVIVQQLGDIVQNLRARGLTILLVEQNYEFALEHSDRICVVEHGRVIATFTADEARRDGSRLPQLLSA